MRAQEVAGGRPRAERVDELEHVVGKLAGAVGSCQALASPLPPSHTPGGSAGRERTTGDSSACKQRIKRPQRISETSCETHAADASRQLGWSGNARLRQLP